jgi:hypothetical protein
MTEQRVRESIATTGEFMKHVETISRQVLAEQLSRTPRTATLDPESAMFDGFDLPTENGIRTFFYFGEPECVYVCFPIAYLWAEDWRTLERGVLDRFIVLDGGPALYSGCQS